MTAITYKAIATDASLYKAPHPGSFTTACRWSNDRLRQACHQRGPVGVASGQVIYSNCGPERLRQVHAAARPSRRLKPSAVRIVLDGADIWSYRTKEVARQIGLLPQTSIAPDGITVADLVARGRYSHQTFIRNGLNRTNVSSLRPWRPRG